MTPTQLLEQAKATLLVDWPNAGVPRALLSAGFTVYGFSPHKYSIAEIVPQQPEDAEGQSIFPPGHTAETGYLVFRAMATRPPRVDLVCTYRPSEELPGIVANHVLPLAARALWVQPPPAACEIARRLATEHGLVCVEGVDIAEAARSIAAQR